MKQFISRARLTFLRNPIIKRWLITVFFILAVNIRQVMDESLNGYLTLSFQIQHNIEFAVDHDTKKRRGS